LATPRKLRGLVDRLTAHGDHVHTLELVPETPAPGFRPGQFLHLALDEYDPTSFWPDSRVFSIASSPTKRNRITISYSVRGRFTARMERELTVGRPVWLKLPYGDFTVDAARPAVLVAGGTGITAFTAFVAGLDPGHRQPVHVAYGARNPGLLIYRELLERQVRTVATLELTLFSEQPAAGVNSGRVSAARLTSQANADFYLSGPPGMIGAVTGELREHGVAPQNIKVDAWE